jgi:hypothetical protein
MELELLMAMKTVSNILEVLIVSNWRLLKHAMKKLRAG